MNFENKYLKYKNKYLKLKNQIGATQGLAAEEPNTNISSSEQNISVEELFNKITDVAMTLKRNNPSNFDGDGFWQSFKGLLKSVDDNENLKDLTWDISKHNELRKKFASQMEVINKDMEIKNGKEVLIERIHFIKQLLYIPRKDDGKCSFRRFMQIALNYGQLLGSISEYEPDLKKLIEDNVKELGNISNYVTKIPVISNKNLLNSIFIKLEDNLTNPPLK